ncbi:MAG: hypothetical protein ACKVU4_12635 [Phycisphaerales bacterium]
MHTTRWKRPGSVLCLAAALMAGAAVRPESAFTPTAPASPRRSTDGPLTGFACKVGPGIPIANGHMYSINFDTGTTVDLGLPVGGVGVQGLAWDPTTSRLYGMTIANPQTGRARLLDLTVMPGTEIGQPFMVGYGLGFSRSPANGKFYAVVYTGGLAFLYDINVTTAASLLIGMDTATSVDGFAIDAQGQGYAAGFGPFQHQFYRVDLATGKFTTVGPLNHGLTGSVPCGLAFDPSGTLWALSSGTDPSRLYNIDLQTGNAVFIRTVANSGWYGALEVVP